MSGAYKNPRKVFENVTSKWAIENIETVAPAVIISVSDYEANRVVDVLPLIMEKQSDGDIIVPDNIYNCPVILQATQEGVFSFPLKVGDKVLIGYAKRSIEEFTYGSTADQYLPIDKRVFGSTDVVVLGYYGQAGLDLPVSLDDAFWKYRNCQITLTSTNAIKAQSGDNNYIEILEDGTITTTNGSGTTVKSPDGTITSSNANCSITQNPNGSVVITNASGDGTLSAGGSWDLNGCIVSVSGNVTTASGSDLDALFSAYNQHIHDKANSTGVATIPIPTA